ncbi:extracellular solute-binding protein family 1 [Beutenbergia cavernae DSM 12333]|uniref:Extracellular solute-binding protein family 1 n=1 Tax=Beutenbergia cavernae (strain ATCC BAA-8 / DSM 12333 / CCUG 43141 / JCM 11478 / NBRC 16432 / NCIMB 13614 / HKI 0122) TaxID=471853 RepID=C5C2P0_BEUC1|nr:extracellular solute-binding protein [Beutenbergia cavernae]ACQ79726.1 extracellular solute-binding protein family 1 [Beutenbergia cavernae DSM 12333]
MAVPRLTRPTRAQLSRRGFLAAGAGTAGLTGLALAGCRGPGASDSAAFDYMTWGSSFEADGVNAALDAFADEKGIDAKPLNVPYDEYAAKLNSLIAAGTPPDAGYVQEGMAMQLGEQGKVVSIADRDEFAGWLPIAKHYWDEENAVGVIALEVITMFHSVEAVQAAGVAPPATMDTSWDWDTFVEQADALTKDASGRSPSESGFDAGDVRQYGVAVPTDLPTLHSLFASNGLSLFNEDGTECLIASPEAIEVVQALSDLIYTHRVAPTPAQASAMGSGSALLLESGRVAMVMGGQWSLIDLAAGDLEYGLGVHPTFGVPAICVVGGANAAFVDSGNEDLALEWMAYEASPETVSLYRDGLWMPMEEKYYTDDELISTWVNDDVHTPAYRTACVDPLVQHGVPYFSFKIKNFPEIEGVLGGGIAPIFAEQTDVAAALEALAAEVAPLMQGAYPDLVEG